MINPQAPMSTDKYKSLDQLIQGTWMWGMKVTNQQLITILQIVPTPFRHVFVNIHANN